MRIGGHGLREHLRLLAPLFGLIAAVWALRLVLDFSGAPPRVVHLCSVSVAGAVSVLAAVWLIHFKRFGSYSNVVVAAFLLVGWEQLLIILAIAFTVFTGMKNVYAATEYSSGLSYARHIAGHLTIGLAMEGLLAAGMSCLLLWLLRRLVPVAPVK